MGCEIINLLLQRVSRLKGLKWEDINPKSALQENTDRWDFGGRIMSAFGTIKLRVPRTEDMKRRRALTEDGDDNDEDGVDCVGHVVMGRRS